MKWLAAASLLALCWVGPAQPPLASVEPCSVRGHGLRVVVGSLLVESDGGRLALVPGQALACRQPAAAQVLARLERALSGLPEGAHTEPLGVHLDPRLPPRQAPLAGIEVHVSSREILVTSSALAELPVAAWRHELLHVLAAAPPELGAGARQLWLSLEEGVVMYLDRAQGARSRAEVLQRSAPPAASAGKALGGGTPAPPYWALALASPGYDPHPLAAELARSLRVLEPEPDLIGWLRCLARPAPLGPSVAAASPARLVALFGERCPARAAEQLSAALGLETGKAAARAAESL